MFNKKNSALLLVFLFCVVPVFAKGQHDMQSGSSGASQTDMNALMGDVESAFSQMKEASAPSALEMTPEDEYYLGRAVAAEILKIYKPYKGDPALTSYLNKICLAITLNSSKPTLYSGYHLEILETDEICAFASPGGHIFVSLGLIACATSEDALAAVIAHEVAHIQLRHAVMAIQNEQTVQSLSAAMERAASIASRNLTEQESSALFRESLSAAINVLFRDGYSREQEFEADWAAGLFLAGAGYDPAAFGELLAVLGERLKNGNMSRTHPSPAERIANLNNNWGGIGRETLSARRDRFSSAMSSSVR